VNRSSRASNTFASSLTFSGGSGGVSSAGRLRRTAIDVARRVDRETPAPPSAQPTGNRSVPTDRGNDRACLGAFVRRQISVYRFVQAALHPVGRIPDPNGSAIPDPTVEVGPCGKVLSALTVYRGRTHVNPQSNARSESLDVACPPASPMARQTRLVPVREFLPHPWHKKDGKRVVELPDRIESNVDYEHHEVAVDVGRTHSPNRRQLAMAAPLFESPIPCATWFLRSARPMQKPRCGILSSKRRRPEAASTRSGSGPPE